MHQLSGPRAVIKGEWIADRALGFANANGTPLDNMFDAQRLLLDELAVAGNELLDRARTEAHLFIEFVSKMAEAHSVQGVKTMYEECSQHQMDFIRRDFERFLEHSQRMFESASKLFMIRN